MKSMTNDTTKMVKKAILKILKNLQNIHCLASSKTFAVDAPPNLHSIPSGSIIALFMHHDYEPTHNSQHA